MAEFFPEGYPQLVRTLLAATGDLGSAEEAAQEAMTRVFGRWGRVSRLDSPIGYAYVVAINVHRRRSRVGSSLWVAKPGRVLERYEVPTS